MRYPPLRYHLERVLLDSMGGVTRTGPLSPGLAPHVSSKDVVAPVPTAFHFGDEAQAIATRLDKQTHKMMGHCSEKEDRRCHSCKKPYKTLKVRHAAYQPQCSGTQRHLKLVVSNLGLLPTFRAGFWQNGFFADFYFWSAGCFRGLCRRIFSFSWEKMRRKILKVNSRQNPLKFKEQISPTHFCRGAGPTAWSLSHCFSELADSPQFSVFSSCSRSCT